MLFWEAMTYLYKEVITIKHNLLFNAVKIAMAAILATTIAEMLNLNYSISAGVVAILSVAPTKKETIKTASSRFIAFVVAIILALIFYNVIGVNLMAFFTYLLIYSIICQYKGWSNSTAVNSVLVSHFLTEGAINIATITNETLIFIIGVSFGIIVNLHLRKDKDYIKQMENETDEQIKQILNRMSQRIIDNNLQNYTGECFAKLDISMQKAKNIAHENFMNQFTSKDKQDIEYINMREKQLHVLYSIYKRVSVIHTQPITAQHISTFLEEVSTAYNKENTVDDLLVKFYELHAELKESPLPVERNEFEDRAHLFVMMRDIEEFLLIKKEFIDKVKQDNL